MIKFKKLIHKETKTIISYEDWKKQIEEDTVMVFAVTEESSWRYVPKNMLISDDFEIVYESKSNTDNKKVAIEVHDDMVFANGWTFTPDDGVNSIAVSIKDLLEELGIEAEISNMS